MGASRVDRHPAASTMGPAGPVFGVCMRTVGRGAELRRALRSVAAQTERRFDVVVVQDGTGDDVTPIVEGFEGSFPVRLIRLPTPTGKSSSANTAAGASSAPWLCLLDEDDAWYPHHLATIARAVDADPAPRVVYTDTAMLTRGGASLPTSGTHRWEFDAAELATMQMAPVACSVAIARAAWDRVGGFDPRLRRVYDDWDLYRRLAQVVPFQHLREVTAKYTMGPPDKGWTHRALFVEALSMTSAAGGPPALWALSDAGARRLSLQRIDAESAIAGLQHRLAEVMRATGQRPQDAPLKALLVDAGWADAPPGTVVAGTLARIRVRVRNSGRAAWGSWGGSAPLFLSYHWLHAGGARAIWDGRRTPLPRDLGAGDQEIVDLLVDAPLMPGPYRLQVDMVQEGVRWASEAHERRTVLPEPADVVVVA